MERSRFVSLSLLLAAALALHGFSPFSGNARAQQLRAPGQAESSSTSELLAPNSANSTYVGLAKCAACHFDQYKDWKGSEHHRAFEILPLKYRNDATCLKCHTTGNPGDATSYEYGVSCQACHGPGEEHSNFALQFANQLLTEEGLSTLRSKIQRLDMRQCVNCHISKAHKKHPPFDRDTVLPRTGQSPSTGFFQNVHGANATSQ